MLPQNGQQQQRQQQQSGLPPFMPTPASGSDSPSYFNLDASQAAKQMAALNVSHARMAANARGPSGSLPGSGGTSSGPYPSGINNPVNYPAGNHDILAASVNANFQFPNNHSTSSTPSSTVNPPFLDPAMSHSTPARTHNQGTSLKQRQQSFLHGLHSIMAKRNTPLPPSLTGIASANYDPSTSPWSMIESSGEVGSFRLAGKDVDLFKLWGLVFQNGGGHSLDSSDGWSAILPQFDLPEHFPQEQLNGSTSVAVMLSQYYMAICYPFEEMYRKNMHEQQKKAQMARQHSQQIPPVSSAGPSRPPVPGTHALHAGGSSVAHYTPGHTPQTPHQRPPSVAFSSQQATSGPSHGLESMQPSAHSPDLNLLDQDLHGIKRKLDVGGGESKRARQKTEPPDNQILAAGVDHQSTETALNPQTSSMLSVPPRSRQQQSRRKIEYVPVAREVDTYGGRDFKAIESEWANLPQRRPLRDINDWGTVDIEALTMSIRSKLSTELSYALTTLTLLSTMRGQTPGSGFPIFQCVDLMDEILDLLEEQAFGDPEADSPSEIHNGNVCFTTNYELVNIVYDDKTHPFAPLARHQGSKDLKVGPRQRPGNIVLTILNIIRNLSVIEDNREFISHHERLVDIMLRICSVVRVDGNPPSPASPNLSLSDLVFVRKDALYTLANIAGSINLSPASSPYKSTYRIARRAFELVASYLTDPNEAISPLACVQLAGVPAHASLKPPLLADIALEVFTKLNQSDVNRQVLTKAVSQTSIWCLFESIVHRLPVVDADFHLMTRDVWLSYLEKTIMAIYSLVFLAPPELKQKIKEDRALGFKAVMFRMVQKFLMNPNPDGRVYFFVCARRAIEAMKVLDDGRDAFDNSSESVLPILSFGMGFSESTDSGFEKGTGLLGGHRDVAWDILMLREVHGDEVMFNELESLARVECF